MLFDGSIKSCASNWGFQGKRNMDRPSGPVKSSALNARYSQRCIFMDFTFDEQRLNA